MTDSGSSDDATDLRKRWLDGPSASPEAEWLSTERRFRDLHETGRCVPLIVLLLLLLGAPAHPRATETRAGAEAAPANATNGDSVRTRAHDLPTLATQIVSTSLGTCNGWGQDQRPYVWSGADASSLLSSRVHSRVRLPQRFQSAHD